jgi:thioredoxin-related protein
MKPLTLTLSPLTRGERNIYRSTACLPLPRWGERSEGPGRGEGKKLAATFILALTLLCAVCSRAHAADTPDAASFFNLNMGDLKTELAEAKRDRKSAVMVMFEQEGCPGCAFMKRNILNRKDVQDYYRAHFATLALDIWSSVPVRDFGDREQTEKAFAQGSKVKGTPTFVFYDLTGREVVRYFGPTQTAEEFLLLGEFVASGAYKGRTFAQYKAEPRATR